MLAALQLVGPTCVGATAILTEDLGCDFDVFPFSLRFFALTGGFEKTGVLLFFREGTRSAEAGGRGLLKLSVLPRAESDLEAAGRMFFPE